METTEIWRPIPTSIASLEASNLGRIRKVTGKDINGQTRVGQVLISCPDKDGYMRVLCNTPQGKFGLQVHQLVMRAFHGPTPVRQVVAHIDGNKLNNRVDNLKYTTNTAQVNVLGHVRPVGDGFSASITWGFQHKYIGTFQTSAQAGEAIDHAVDASSRALNPRAIKYYTASYAH